MKAALSSADVFYVGNSDVVFYYDGKGVFESICFLYGIDCMACDGKDNIFTQIIISYIKYSIE